MSIYQASLEKDMVRVDGFADSSSTILVTWKSDTGEDRVSSFDVNGLFSKTVAVKGRVTDILEIPIFKTRATLYVQRLVKNADQIGDWFRIQGMETIIAPGDMHVTVAYSKSEVDWEGLDSDRDEMEVPSDVKRSVTPLGDKGAVVLKFESPVLQSRWATFRKAGASWDYPSYQPHVTLTYKSDPATLWTPYHGPIILGPEMFSEVNQDWTATEKADRKSPPKGYPEDRSEYAVPDEYEFPIDGKHIHAAIGYFSSHRFKDESQKRSAAKRILHAARKHGVHVDDDSDVARAANGG